MKPTCGQCFVVPAEDGEMLVKACANEVGSPTIKNAHVLASRFANEESEAFVVVQIVRVVNPDRERAKD